MQAELFKFTHKLWNGAECFKKTQPGLEDAAPQEVVGI